MRGRIIHRSAWKENSANFALTAFSEVRPAFGGHTIVCLIKKMLRTAPAQMANKQTKNATVECRPNLLNGARVRALSTTSSATLASMAATDAIERKALWIIRGHYIPSMISSPGPTALALIHEVPGSRILRTSR